MKAIRLHGHGGPDYLVYDDAPQPRPGAEEVLVCVYATGVIANELKWDATYQTKAGSPRALPIPGRDLSGVVEAVGYGVTAPARGDEVYAMLDYGCDGAGAEFTIALPSELASKPRTLDHVQAAAAPARDAGTRLPICIGLVVRKPQCETHSFLMRLPTLPFTLCAYHASRELEAFSVEGRALSRRFVVVLQQLGNLCDC